MGGGHGGPTDPEEGGRQEQGAQHAGEEPVFDVGGHGDQFARHAAALGVGVLGGRRRQADEGGVGDLVGEDGDEGRKRDAGDGGEKGEAVLLEREVVGRGEDGRDDDEPGEEDGEVEEEGEADEEDGRLRYELQDWVEQRMSRHGAEGGTTFGQGEMVWHAGFAGAAADDFSGVGFGEVDCEDHDERGEHQRCVLGPPEGFLGYNEAGDDGAEGCAEVAGRCKHGVISAGDIGTPDVSEGTFDEDEL